MQRFAAALLIVLAVGWRWINYKHSVLPNLEFITVGIVLAALFLPKSYAFFVAAASIVISDMLIGNSNIALFTWSAWLQVAICAGVLTRVGVHNKPKLAVFASTTFGLGAGLWFFLWTNFGVWFLGHGTTAMYPKTFSGLIDSYIAGIPFYRNMAYGNLVIIPLAVTSVLLAKAYFARRQQAVAIVS